MMSQRDSEILGERLIRVGEECVPGLEAFLKRKGPAMRDKLAAEFGLSCRVFCNEHERREYPTTPRLPVGELALVDDE